MKKSKIYLALIVLLVALFVVQLGGKLIELDDKVGLIDTNNITTENKQMEEERKKLSQVEITEPAVSVPTAIVENEGVNQKYYLHKDIIATIFWVGEESNLDNDYIANDQSAWDSNWTESYGGIDSPDERNRWYPGSFVPKENPFYVALPYSDFDTDGKKGDVSMIPWFEGDVAEGLSLIKNRWLRVVHEDKECYAQWENTGPNLSDDIGYVFGSARPSNTFGQKAGIDISPAVRDCLGVGSTALVDWQFVDSENVPNGPWNEIVTTSLPNWSH